MSWLPKDRPPRETTRGAAPFSVLPAAFIANGPAFSRVSSRALAAKAILRSSSQRARPMSGLTMSAITIFSPLYQKTPPSPTQLMCSPWPQ